MKDVFPIATAPKDRRILGYGMVAWDTEPGWATVKWYEHHGVWQCDPSEASEYSPEACILTFWTDLPGPP